MYVKLKKDDNWGNITYVYKDKTYKPKRECLVKFPDGKTKKLKVIKRISEESVSDMGRTSVVLSDRYYAKVPVSGTLAEIEICKLKIDMGSLIEVK